MVRQRIGRRRIKHGLGSGLTPRARAVMKAFREARRQAPGFIVSCGILPEVSESATERLHVVVRDVAERHLEGSRHLRAVQRAVRDNRRIRRNSDEFERGLTELIGSEATAAYLFGLAVGLTLQALPDRLNGLRK